MLITTGFLNEKENQAQLEREAMIDNLRKEISTEVVVLVYAVPELWQIQQNRLVQSSVKLLLHQRVYRGK